jgi:hypothetical protein
MDVFFPCERESVLYQPEKLVGQRIEFKGAAYDWPTAPTFGIDWSLGNEVMSEAAAEPPQRHPSFRDEGQQLQLDLYQGVKPAGPSIDFEFAKDVRQEKRTISPPTRYGDRSA